MRQINSKASHTTRSSNHSKNSLSPAPNKLIEQHRFLSRIQEEKESIGEYVAALRKFLTTYGSNCSCGKSVVEIFLRAQFIRGIKDSSIREKLIQERDIGFQAAVDKALALETSQLDNQEIKKAKPTFNSSEVKEINRVSRASSRRNQRICIGKNQDPKIDQNSIESGHNPNPDSTLEH